LFISNFSVAFPLRVNSHIATICSVHARPANESLDAGHSQGPRGATLFVSNFSAAPLFA
jgi:hypothetical protein